MSQPAPSDEISVRYEQSIIQLTTQFILSASAEELVLDCSSGPLLDEEKQRQVLPIHARHALPWSAARRLCDSLQQALRQHELYASQGSDAGSTAIPARHAGLPRLESTHGER